MSPAIFFSSFSILSFLLNKNGAQALIGGTAAELDEYPFNAALKRGSEYVCSGGIISKSHVVTAAHCVINIETMTFEDKPTYVRIGTANYRADPSEGVMIEVEKIFIPNDFFRKVAPYTEVGDIAVLQLSRRVDLNIGKVRLKTLRLPGDESYVNEEATITAFGWDWIDYGRNEDGKKVVELGGSSGRLRAARAQVLPRFDCQCEDCKPFDTDRHLCARIHNPSFAGRKATCFGDSGAPLVYGRNTLIGVLSSSSQLCDELGVSGAYTRVSHYVEFIVRAMLDVKDSTIRVLKPSPLMEITSNDVPS